MFFQSWNTGSNYDDSETFNLTLLCNDNADCIVDSLENKKGCGKPFTLAKLRIKMIVEGLIEFKSM